MFPAVIFLVFVFLCLSAFTGFFLLGGFYPTYYKEFSFFFLRTLANLFRGSLDSVDYDPSINRHAIDSNSPEYFKEIKYARSPYLSIMKYSNYFPFIFYSLIFTFFGNFIIKVIITAKFLISYRMVSNPEKEKKKF